MRRGILGGILLAAISGTAWAAPDAAAGKAKFQLFCASCHGATGKGDGAAAAGLNPKPRNFQDAAAMGKKTDADLTAVIKEGGPAKGLSAMMPPWKASLSDADVANILAFVRSLATGGK